LGVGNENLAIGSISSKKVNLDDASGRNESYKSDDETSERKLPIVICKIEQTSLCGSPSSSKYHKTMGKSPKISPFGGKDFYSLNNINTIHEGLSNTPLGPSNF